MLAEEHIRFRSNDGLRMLRCAAEGLFPPPVAGCSSCPQPARRNPHPIGGPEPARPSFRRRTMTGRAAAGVEDLTADDNNPRPGTNRNGGCCYHPQSYARTIGDITLMTTPETRNPEPGGFGTLGRAASGPQTPGRNRRGGLRTTRPAVPGSPAACSGHHRPGDAEVVESHYRAYHIAAVSFWTLKIRLADIDQLRKTKPRTLIWLSDNRSGTGTEGPRCPECAGPIGGISVERINVSA